MNISKDRLLEIENELNDLTIVNLTRISKFEEYRNSSDWNKVVKCPHCNKTGKTPAFRRDHFNKCKLKDVDLKQFINDISNMRTIDVRKKYELSGQFIDRYRIFMGIEYKMDYSLSAKPKLAQRSCPHCKMKGLGSQFKRYHFDNCFFKNIDLIEFNKFIIENNDDIICKKYGIDVGKLKRYRKYFNIKKPHWKLRIAK